MFPNPIMSGTQQFRGGDPVRRPMPIGPPPPRFFNDPTEGRSPMPVGPAPPIQRAPILGVMHKGGKVKKTGAYQLKKGETVVPTKGKLTAKEHLKGAVRRKYQSIGHKSKMVSVSALKA